MTVVKSGFKYIFSGVKSECPVNCTDLITLSSLLLFGLSLWIFLLDSGSNITCLRPSNVGIAFSQVKQCPNSLGFVLFLSTVNWWASLQCNNLLFTPCAFKDAIPLLASSAEGEALKIKWTSLIIVFLSAIDPFHLNWSHSDLPIALKYFPSRYVLGSPTSPNKSLILEISKFILLNPISSGLWFSRFSIGVES